MKGARRDNVENEGVGSVDSSVGSGVRGVVAVLDDGHEMDPCSCDLVKVSVSFSRCPDARVVLTAKTDHPHSCIK